MSVRQDANTASSSVDECLQRIEAVNPQLNSVITLAGDSALEAARAADAATNKGDWLGLLHGVPMLIKDNIDTAGIRSTSGASFLAEHVPNRDATVVRRLRAAGAIVLGKSNLHELCFGIRSNNSVAGQCHNPWSAEHIPGGSSGGSGASLAADFCVGALGSDTGGSVRLPASMNGVSGLRPTVGRVPNTGSMAVSGSQDTIGPMARRVSDVARILAVIAGYDDADPVTVSKPLSNFLPTLDDGIEGVRIGIPRAGYFDGADPSVEAAVRQAARELERLGARLVEVDVPGMQDTHRWASVVIFSDACALHRERLDTTPEAFDPETLKRMRTGLNFTGADYADAMRMRERWQRTLAQLFDTVDVLLSPTVHTEVPLIDDNKDLLQATRDATRNTYAGAFGQIPGLSIPCGFSTAGLPVGLQLEAAWWEEPLLLRIGHSFQKVTDWHLRTPG
jgi:aspartyl-tRNA(Asn)/glutamyl-tRNA(Gln) amidotransferase subunit A